MSKRRQFFMQLGVSLVIGIVLTLTIGWVKLAVHDKPQYRSRLTACLTNPLCDPSPYIVMGWPWPYGVNDDISGSVRLLHFNNAPDEYAGGNYTDDYFGFTGDLVIFTALSYGGLLIRQLWLHLRRSRKSE